MPTTTTVRKAKPAKKRSEFQRMMTPEEMREEMKRICRNKRTEDAFFRKIMNFSPPPSLRKKAQVEAR